MCLFTTDILRPTSTADLLSKCDGSQPCKLCTQRRVVCTFTGGDKRTKSEQSQIVKSLQLEIKQLRSALKVFEFGSEEQAWTALRQLRTHPAEVQSVPEVVLGHISDKASARTSSLPRLIESEFIQVITDNNARRHEPDIPIKGTADVKKLYSKVNLPPRDFAQRGARVLFQVINGLFHVMTEADFERLYTKIYSSSDDSVDDSDIAELCAFAAVGCQYLPEASNEVKDLFLESALRYVNYLIDSDVTRACRVLSCFGGYGVVEKRRSSRILIQLGLELCRNGSEADFGGLNGRAERVKLHRTLIFLDCWLATSLGYQSEHSTTEIDHVLTASASVSENSLGDRIQLECAKVIILKQQMMQQAYSPSSLNSRAIESNMHDLEDWYRLLPPSMSLTSLMAGTAVELHASEQGALFLAHALHLGSVIMLLRPVLVAMNDARNGGKWPYPDITPSQARKYHEHCVRAARSLARIFILLKFGTSDTNMNIRCWLCIFEIFTCCSVLLYDMAVRFLTHTVNDITLVEDLDRVGACMEMLRASGEVDAVAEKLYRALLAQHQAICKLHNEAMIGRDASNNARSHIEQCLSDSVQQPLSHENPRAKTPPTAGVMGSVVLPAERQGMRSCACVVATQLVQQGAKILMNPFGHRKEDMDTLISRTARQGDDDWWESALIERSA